MPNQKTTGSVFYYSHGCVTIVNDICTATRLS